MALIFPDSGDNLPRTHALVIGVGGYRHLLGGIEEKAELMQNVGLLKQLTSPPRSAMAFAQWLVEAEHNWRAQLGSVDLLISLAPQDSYCLPAGIPAEAATISNIQDAYRRWRERCDRHEDNIAVFYFCGHGVEKIQQHLLAEDFGANPNNPWLGSFAFDITRLAFHSCRSKTQCFFIDACRKITSDMLIREPTIIPLEVQNYTVPECAFNLTMQASARNETALGPKRGVSYFTQALIRALRGGAATQGNQGWVIETSQVSAKITQIMRMVKDSEGFKQRCSRQVTDNTEILRAETPRVELLLKCSPKGANEEAQLTCSRIDVPNYPDAQHQGAPWTLEVDPGFYNVLASFATGRFREAKESIIASPPMESRMLRCEI